MIEEQIKIAAEKAVLEFVKEGGWIMPDYSRRIKLPNELLQDIWKTVDIDVVRTRLKARIEEELADRIVTHIAAELATDIKQILSVTERREAVRALAREHLESIMKKGIS